MVVIDAALLMYRSTAKAILAVYAAGISYARACQSRDMVSD